jgi:single-strand DNA-binding protein
MSGSVNRVTLIGRLGKDPESRSFQDVSTVVNFSVATSDQWTDKQSGERKQSTQWHQISIWNEALGEIATRFLKKGAQVYLEGRLETRSWDKDGATHYATEVVLRPYNSDLQMLGSAPSPDRPAEPPAQSRRAARRQPSGRD